MSASKLAVSTLALHLRQQIAKVDAGEIHEDACCTLVAPSMKGTGIRPEMVSVKPNGERIYLLNVKQCRKLLARIEEAMAQAREHG